MRLNNVVCRVHAEIDGVKYEPGPIKASEAEKITAWTGYTVREWELGMVGEDDALAAKAMIALFQFRAGENVKFSSIEIEDMDSIRADFKDEYGRVVSGKMDDTTGKPVLLNGNSVLLFDGEELEVPTPAASPTE